MIRVHGVEGARLVALPGAGAAAPGALWIDLMAPTEAEEAEVEAALAIDLPTRKEMREIEQTSRLYSEGEAQFMTAMIPAQAESDAPIMEPVTFVLTRARLVTIRYHEPRAFELFIQRAAKGHTACTDGEEVMLGLLEVMVDRLGDVLEKAGQDIEQISRRVFARDKQRSRRGPRWQVLLEEIGRKGGLVSTIRDSLGTLDRLTVFLGQRLRGEGGAAPEDRRARLHDLGSDIRSLADHAGFVGQKVNFLLDATLGLIGIEQNTVMQIFSVVSVVFLPPTLVASVYGMNFAVMPELSWPWGYPAALGLILISALLPYLYFRRKGWL